MDNSSAGEVIRADEALPRHIAIIMDGNGRWARQMGYERLFGHRAAIKAVRESVEECTHLGVKQLTLYAFSTENWKRPKAEVAGLMQLYRHYLASERETILKNNVRFTAVGRVEEMPDAVRRQVEKTTEESRGNTGLALCLALNYGGRREIVDAAREIALKAVQGKLKPNSLTEEEFARYLYMPDMPDVDLLIRTAGEMRVSNFLLWQISYAELCVLPICWPEFRKEHLHEAIAEYQRRRRTFGGTPARL